MLSKLRRAILLGLQLSGRDRTFSEVLNDDGIPFTSSQLLDAAHSLEALGLIQSVTYQLPLEVRAELTSYGREYLVSAQNDSEHFRQST